MERGGGHTAGMEGGESSPLIPTWVEVGSLPVSLEVFVYWYRWEPPRDRRHSSSDDLPRPPRGVSRRDRYAVLCMCACVRVCVTHLPSFPLLPPFRGTDYRERERGGSWERDYHRDREWGGYYERDREYIEGRRPRPGSYHDRCAGDLRPSTLELNSLGPKPCYWSPGLGEGEGEGGGEGVTSVWVFSAY